MEVVDWHVAREQRAMYAEQRVALDADDLALRPTVGRIALAAPDKVRQRVVDDGHFGARRPGIEEERLVPVNYLRNRAGQLRRVP